MCTPELTAMLACWAATGDLHNRQMCRETAQNLFQCMRTAVRSFTLYVGSIFTHFFLMAAYAKESTQTNHKLPFGQTRQNHSIIILDAPLLFSLFDICIWFNTTEPRFAREAD